MTAVATTTRTPLLLLIGLEACTAPVGLLPPGSVECTQDDACDAGHDPPEAIPDGELPDGSVPDTFLPDDGGMRRRSGAVAAGAFHTCALVMSGAECWGDNGSGELGIGTAGDTHELPVSVLGLGRGAEALVAGAHHTCALLRGGGVECWGLNQNGEVGSGVAGGNRTVPVPVLTLGSGVQALAAGENHTCALTKTDVVTCWGLNMSGQLGIGIMTDNRPTPVKVHGLEDSIQAISLGEYHSCALTYGGIVWCWGENSFGQLGNGSTKDSNLPIQVRGLPPARAIAAGGYHTCALLMDGAVECWGLNWSGQLGNGSTSNSLVPVAVSGLKDVQAIAAGEYHSGAITKDGGLVFWGQNKSGQLGDDSTTDRLLPTQVSGITKGASIITLGEDHSCALLEGGIVECWGENASGQLGNGTMNSSLKPAPVSL